MKVYELATIMDGWTKIKIFYETDEEATYEEFCGYLDDTPLKLCKRQIDKLIIGENLLVIKVERW